MVREFVIPLNKDDLLQSSSTDQYAVRQKVARPQIPNLVRGLSGLVNSADTSTGGPYAILANFDTLFSLLVDLQHVDRSVITSAWETCILALSKINNLVARCDLDTSPDRLRAALKMTIYVLWELMVYFENMDSTVNAIVLPKRGRKKTSGGKSTAAAANASHELSGLGVGWEWNAERVDAFQHLAALFACPHLPTLWHPPIVEDSFVNLVTKMCCKSLENAELSKANNKPCRDFISKIFAHTIGLFPNQNEEIARKMVDLLKNYEQSSTAVTDISLTVIITYDNPKFLFELVREIGSTDPSELAKDSDSTRAISQFLTEMAPRVPQLLFKYFSFLMPHFQEESHTFRSCLCTISGEVLIHLFRQQQQQQSEQQDQSEQQKKARDELLEELQLHVHDHHANVRARAVSVLTALLQARAVPISSLVDLLKWVAPSVDDVSSNVRKNVIQFFAVFISACPFAFKYPRDEFEHLLAEEKKKLEDIESQSSKQQQRAQLITREEAEQMWEQRSASVVRAIVSLQKSAEQADGEDKENCSFTEDASVEEDLQEQPPQVQEEDSDPPPDIATMLMGIREQLEREEYVEAARGVKRARHLFPDCPVFAAAAANRHDSSMDESVDEEEESIARKRDLLIIHDLLKAVFIAPFAKLSVNVEPAEQEMGGGGGGFDVASLVNMNPDQIEALIQSQQTRVLLLQKSLSIQRLFTGQIVPSVVNLLGSPTQSDVTISVEFVVACVDFGLDVRPGLRSMMGLLASSDPSVRKLVVSAFQRVYFSDSTAPHQVARNLLWLACEEGGGGTLSSQLCLHNLVGEFVKLGQLGDRVINYLWEVFTLKHPDTHTHTDRVVALQIIAMAAREKKDIIKSNIDVVIRFGLQEDPSDFTMANQAINALMALSDHTTNPTTEEKFRFPESHPIVTSIVDVLVKGMTETSSLSWCEMADSGVAAMFALVQSPIRVVQEMVVKCYTRGFFHSEEAEGGPPRPMEEVNEEVARRFMTFIGNVAVRTAVFLEVNVLNEVKRKKREAENAKETARASKRAKLSTPSTKPDNKPDDTLNVSVRSRGRMSYASTVASESGELTEMTGGHNTVDEAVETIKGVCDEAMVTGEGLLAQFAPLVAACLLHIPGSSGDQHLHASAPLRAAAASALANFMMVGLNFCQEHLRLYFTLMEKEPDAVIRSNLMVFTGDLIARFPNAMDPWTPHIYARLRDRSDHVRLVCIITISQLILKEMVKVKGQISEMARCIVDHNPQIAGSARFLFDQLAQKNNALYNVLPDLISRLSVAAPPPVGDRLSQKREEEQLGEAAAGPCPVETEEEEDEEKFHEIISYIIKLLPREKLSELLVDKLCQRFKVISDNERQCRDLGFVLSQLHFGDKAFNKLAENVACYAPRLKHNPDLAHYFHAILDNCRRNCKQELKNSIAELESAIEAAVRGGGEGEDEEQDESSGADEKPPTAAAAASAGVQSESENDENMFAVPSTPASAAGKHGEAVKRSARSTRALALSPQTSAERPVNKRPRRK